MTLQEKLLLTHTVLKYKIHNNINNILLWGVVPIGLIPSLLSFNYLLAIYFSIFLLLLLLWLIKISIMPLTLLPINIKWIKHSRSGLLLIHMPKDFLLIHRPGNFLILFKNLFIFHLKILIISKIKNNSYKFLTYLYGYTLNIMSTVSSFINL
jgi:hypothetical protein